MFGTEKYRADAEAATRPNRAGGDAYEKARRLDEIAEAVDAVSKAEYFAMLANHRRTRAALRQRERALNILLMNERVIRGMYPWGEVEL